MILDILREINGLENYGKFIHRKSNRVYVSKTEDLMKLEFKNKKWLYELPKSTIINCFEFTIEKGVGNKVNIFTLDELRIITSFSRNDLNEIFYIGK